jgi:hypothetical protein
MIMPKIIYETESGEEITALREEARKLRDEAAKLRGVRGMEAGAREREAEAARLEERAGERWEAARLETLTVYKGDVVKKLKAGEATYTYWYASWREGGKIVNKYLGSVEKMTREAATAKARKLKAEALGILSLF